MSSSSYTPYRGERTPYSGPSVFAQINELQQRVADLEAALQQLYDESFSEEEESGVWDEGSEAVRGDVELPRD